MTECQKRQKLILISYFRSNLKNVKAGRSFSGADSCFSSEMMVHSSQLISGK